MDSYLYLILFFILSVIAVLVFWGPKSRRELLDAKFSNDFRDEAVSISERDEPSLLGEARVSLPAARQSLTRFNQLKQPINDVLSISVFAKHNNRFASYDLLQAITATGMQFGEMNIFHYYHRTPVGQRISLFNLASATNPGTFDLDRMGNFSCIGLTLFMDIKQVPNPSQAFYLMVNTADQLAEDLEGELRANPKTLWTDEHFQHYQQQILQLEPVLSV